MSEIPKKCMLAPLSPLETPPLASFIASLYRLKLKLKLDRCPAYIDISLSTFCGDGS